MRNIKKIVSTGLGVTLWVIGSSVVEAMDSTTILPPATQPGGITVLARGTVSNIYTNPSNPPVTLYTASTATCPLNTHKERSVSLSGTDRGCQNGRLDGLFIACDFATLPPGSYNLVCSDARLVCNLGNATVNLDWVIYCVPN